MPEASWSDVLAALDGDAPVRFWLRDDDAVAVTPALDRLGDLAQASGVPLLLAVIPAGATPALAAWAAARGFVTPCQHGYAHRNHAGAGERACELGGARDDDAVLEDLAMGRAAMDAVFGAAWSRVLVPPWNRIRPTLIPALPTAGYTALSTFASGTRASEPPLPMLDCDLDIIDWRNGRRGRSDQDLCGRLLPLIGAARRTGAPIGLLTHHLAHDAQAWQFLATLLPLLRDHPGALLVATDGDDPLLPLAGEDARQGG